MRKDEKIFFLMGDTGYNLVEPLFEEFPDRTLNVGVAEQNMIGIAAGLCNMGFKPVCYAISQFLTQRSYEQVRNDLCFHDYPVTLVGTSTGLDNGPLWATHYVVDDIGCLKTLPNIHIYSPSSTESMEKIFNETMNLSHPSYIRITKSSFSESKTIEGVNRFILENENSDTLVISHGRMIKNSLDAARIFPGFSIFAMDRIKPVDDSIADIIKNYTNLVIIEDNFKSGLYSTICQFVAEKKINGKYLYSISVDEDFGAITGDTSFLHNKFGLSADQISNFIKKLTGDASIGVPAVIGKNIVEKILRIRLSQMLINEDYKKSKFKIPIHLAFGHESIATAVSQIMNKNDKLVLSHRNIAYNLARLGKLKPILDAYYLKSSGLTDGKTGSMNLINREKGIFYTSSILGNNFSVSTGIAMGEKIRSQEGITIILAGDGAIEEGSFHESLLLLKSLELSALVIIENNEWSMSTKINERRHSINLEKFAEASAIKYVKLSGNNPIQYIEKLDDLKQFSLKEKTPVLIEVMVATLGSRILKTPELPDGQLINYHAGPAPTINLEKDNPKIIDDISDPIFVLEKHVGTKTIEEITKTLLKELNSEIK